MYCNNCGNEVKDGEIYCPKCGYRFQRSEEVLSRQSQLDKISRSNMHESYKKSGTAVGIINIIASVFLIMLFLYDIMELQSQIMPLLIAMVVLPVCILQVLKKQGIAIGIIRIVGSILILWCALQSSADEGWGYAGILIGGSFLILGILCVTNRRLITQNLIAMGSGCIFVEFGLVSGETWGAMSIICGISFIMEGLLENIMSPE